MAGLRIPRAHSNDWYDQLAKRQSGYYNPWQSRLAPRNGNAAFSELIRELIKPTDRVLEVACGHGEQALEFAPLCEQLIAYDRVPSYIELAREKQAAAGIDNVTFKVHDALNDTEDKVTLPVEDQSVDMIICRLGPTHWIEDAARVCRPGSWLIQLSPMEEPIPAWTDMLPHVMHYENSGRYSGAGSIHHSVENRLHQAGLLLHSGWGFDVPEMFQTPEDLYAMMSWGLPEEKTPPFEDVAFKLGQVFERHAHDDGVELRHCRYLWCARIP